MNAAVEILGHDGSILNWKLVSIVSFYCLLLIILRNLFDYLDQLRANTNNGGDGGRGGGGNSGGRGDSGGGDSRGYVEIVCGDDVAGGNVEIVGGDDDAGGNMEIVGGDDDAGGNVEIAVEGHDKDIYAATKEITRLMSKPRVERMCEKLEAKMVEPEAGGAKLTRKRRVSLGIRAWLAKLQAEIAKRRAGGRKLTIEQEAELEAGGAKLKTELEAEAI